MSEQPEVAGGWDRRGLLKRLGAAGAVSGVVGAAAMIAEPGVAAAATGDLESEWAFVEAYGADPTGAADSTSAFNQAIATGKQVAMGAGTYKIGTSSNLTAFGRKQGMMGLGSALTSINYVGSSTCLQAYDSSFSTSASFGGSFFGFTISGYSAGAGAIGFSWGNLIGGRVRDVSVYGFEGTGSIGLLFKNGSSGYSEQSDWTAIGLTENTSNVVFDTGSFDYSVYQFLIVADANQNGVTLRNAAALQGVRMEVRGNFHAGSSNTGWVLGLDPTGGGSGTSVMNSAQLFVNVECDGSSGQVGHTTIKLGGSSSTQLSGVGVMNFLTTGGQATFTAASLSGGLFGFSGAINEASLNTMIPGDGLVVQGGTSWTEAGSFSGYGYNNMYIYVESGDVQAMILPNGNITVAGFYGAPYKKARRLELFVKQPSASAWGTITWPSNVKWAGGTHALSASANAVDKITLTYLPSENTWYGKVDLAFA